MKSLLVFSAAALLWAMATQAGAADKIRIASEGAYPPYNYMDANGKLAGFEIDLGAQLCKRMQVECEFLAQNWDGIIPGLTSKKYDAIMAGMSDNEERRKVITFSEAYSQVPSRFVTVKDSEISKAQSLEEVKAALKGKVIGAQGATIQEAFLQKAFPDATLRSYPTQEDMNLDISGGRIDAALADVTAWLDFLKTEKGAKLALFGPDLNGKSDPIFGIGVAVGLRQEDKELQEKFSKAILEMKADGSLSQLATKHFGFDASVK
jgi:lysine-arginine-ornithine-binding protein